jgi:hypothetical protein
MFSQMKSSIIKVRSPIAFICGLCASIPAWAYRGGRGEGDAAFSALILLVFLVFVFLFLVGYFSGQKNPSEAIFVGVILSMFAVVVGAVVANFLGTAAGWVAGVGVIFWFTKNQLLPVLKSFNSRENEVGTGTQRHTRQQPAAVMDEQEKERQQDTEKRMISEKALLDALTTREKENEESKRKQEAELVQQQRRVEADRKARAQYERLQKAEQERLLEIQERSKREHEGREQEAIEQKQRKALAEQELAERNAEARRQWDLAQRAERIRLRYLEGREVHEPGRPPHLVPVRDNAPQIPAPTNSAPPASSQEEGVMPILRADHWRKKGNVLVCLASGANFERGQYRIEDGYYIVNTSQHRGKVRAAEVADLIRHRK